MTEYSHTVSQTHSPVGWKFLKSLIQTGWFRTVAVALFICLVPSDLNGSLRKFADMSMGNCFSRKMGDEIVIVCMIAKGTWLEINYIVMRSFRLQEVMIMMPVKC